jgi:hypothetical protein
MPVSKKQAQIQFKQKTGLGKKDLDHVQGPATQERVLRGETRIEIAYYQP